MSWPITEARLTVTMQDGRKRSYLVKGDMSVMEGASVVVMNEDGEPLIALRKQCVEYMEEIK